MVGDDAGGQLEPEHREPRQHLPLAGDRRRVHRVVGRDAVRGDHQQAARRGRTSRGPCPRRRAAGRSRSATATIYPPARRRPRAARVAISRQRRASPGIPAMAGARAPRRAHARRRRREAAGEKRRERLRSRRHATTTAVPSGAWIRRGRLAHDEHAHGGEPRARSARRSCERSPAPRRSRAAAGARARSTRAPRASATSRRRRPGSRRARRSGNASAAIRIAKLTAIARRRAEQGDELAQRAAARPARRRGRPSSPPSRDRSATTPGRPARAASASASGADERAAP